MRTSIVKYWLAATKLKTRTQNYTKQSNHNYSSAYKNFYSQGFTLLELLLTLIILVTITTIALPSFITTLRTWEAKEVRSHITDGFRIAKAHSFMQRQDTILCLADANYHCHKQAKEYLLIFSDIDGNHQFDSAINQMILQQPLHLYYGRVYLHAGKRNYIKFFGDSGLPRGHFGHIKYCPNNHSIHNMYQISLNQQGNHRFKPYRLKKTGCP